MRSLKNTANTILAAKLWLKFYYRQDLRRTAMAFIRRLHQWKFEFEFEQNKNYENRHKLKLILSNWETGYRVIFETLRSSESAWNYFRAKANAFNNLKLSVDSRRTLTAAFSCHSTSFARRSRIFRAFRILLFGIWMFGTQLRKIFRVKSRFQLEVRKMQASNDSASTPKADGKKLIATSPN